MFFRLIVRKYVILNPEYIFSYGISRCTFWLVTRGGDKLVTNSDKGGRGGGGQNG